MLKIQDLHTSYGAIKALKGINMEVRKDEIVCLIGSNGAGKSTLVNTVAGLIKSDTGSIYFGDENIGILPAHKLTSRGISLSPEGREVFPALSVEQNLMLGAFIIDDKEQIDQNFNRVYEIFPKLKERKNQLAGTLSGGEQQMLAIGRALMISPKLLLLDEPSLGIAPNLVVEIFNMIKYINEKYGTTILLIEQNANIALQVSNRAYVMENGVISMEGESKDIANNPEVRRIYLGI